jgi:NOL1/NOP2/fmu family ribosome biogenesis protein
LNNYDREFYFRKAGTLLGEVKGRDFVPDHELALSSDLVHKLNRVDVDLENALQFMRKQAIDVGSGEKGFAQVCYNGLGLGWIKILDRRSNNYLPPHAKILM